MYEIFQIFSNILYKIGTIDGKIFARNFSNFSYKIGNNINGKIFVRNFSNFFKFYIQNWCHQWENFCTKFFKFFQIFHTKLVPSMGKVLYEIFQIFSNFSYKIGIINGKIFVRNFSNFFKFFIQNW